MSCVYPEAYTDFRLSEFIRYLKEYFQFSIVVLLGLGNKTICLGSLRLVKQLWLDLDNNTTYLALGNIFKKQLCLRLQCELTRMCIKHTKLLVL